MGVFIDAISVQRNLIMSNKVFTDGDVTKFLDSYGEPAPHEWKDYMPVMILQRTFLD